MADQGDPRTYIRERRKLFEEKKGLVDKMGKHRGDFADVTEYNKSAIADLEKIDRWSPEKRADYLRTFDELRRELAPLWDQEETAEMDFGPGVGIAAAQKAQRERRPKKAKNGGDEPIDDVGLLAEELADQNARDAAIDTSTIPDDDGEAVQRPD